MDSQEGQGSEEFLHEDELCNLYLMQLKEKPYHHSLQKKKKIMETLMLQMLIYLTK